MLGFWFLEVSSLLFVYMLLSFFCSGHMFPIDLLPGFLGELVHWMPLQYLAFFPAAVFLQRVTGPELVAGLWTQLAWVVFFLVAARGTFHFGVRRNSLVRDMTFRANFIIDTLSSISWVLMNLGFYVLVFQYTDEIGHGTVWGKYEFFLFLATTLLVNNISQGLFLMNADELSEQIRTGTLDFAL